MNFAIVQGDVYRDFLATLPVLKEKVTRRPTTKTCSVALVYGVYDRMRSAEYGTLDMSETDETVNRWAPGMHLKSIRVESHFKPIHAGSVGSRIVFEYARRPRSKDKPL